MFRVLLPVDNDTERSTRQAEFAASLPHADENVEVTLIHVFPDEGTAERTSVEQVAAGRQAHEYLTGQGIAVRTQSHFGDAASEILHAADDIDADLVVLGGRKRSPLGSLLFGSVSQSVTLDASRPVTVTGGATGPAEASATEEALATEEASTADEATEGDVTAESGDTRV
ncbi:Nucleotide-binding universal stress protein, UspA family [Halogranum amylolyticum]|uniref:Nucleotide-binding universal stress protein, UspA family n=1 Tax=Halogranum amylolyticum TaxID=660520 RepID=A0A1H8PHZ1_9EURY|nr:universal stress protein [Halogranum amylolyticum]SEO41344.1 Nucleotide-binding universal stress protein, UspA family [Halogranum amylolyticum]